MNIAIALENISKTYARGWRRQSVEALSDISLSIPKGETFGFVGPNGAGKSTTIKILVGGLLEFSGSASLFGADVHDPKARTGLGYVPENPSLSDYLTPLELLEMGRRMHRCPDVENSSRKECMLWLERFGIADVAHRQIRSFSKGMAQRTALAHALVINPRLLILDEPLSGLDPIGRREVVDILAEYKKNGGTLFFTSHVLHDVERLADRFGLIHKGRMIAVQSPSDLLNQEQVVTVRSAGVNAMPGFVAENAERWVAEVPREQLWKVLKDIELAGHQIVEIKPSLSLESAFFKILGRDNGMTGV